MTATIAEQPIALDVKACCIRSLQRSGYQGVAVEGMLLACRHCRALVRLVDGRWTPAEPR